MKVAWRGNAVALALGALLGCGGGTIAPDGGPGELDSGMDAGEPGECRGQPDGTPCGADDICVAGRCAVSRCGDGYLDEAAPEQCDDGNDVAFDGCEPGTCTYTCSTASECSDSDPCNGAEPCGATTHFCEPGVALPDGVRCVVDSVTDGVCRASRCVPAGCGNGVLDGSEECDDSSNGDDADGCRDDCRYSCHDDRECDDGDVCDGTDTCDTTTHRCVVSAALECDDGDACTSDSCDPVLGCRNALIDGDGDGYPPSTITGCGTDCDDARADVNPGMTELCDAIDHDCDGSPTSAADPFWFPDCDGDDFAPLDAAALGQQRCSEPPPMSGCAGGWTTRRPQSSLPSSLDCDDASAARHPLATESVGDGVDQDCSGGELCYVDADGDGYRTLDGRTVASADGDCSDAGEALASLPSTDCDDTRAATHPGASEVCNGFDDNCSGVIDEGVRTTYYADGDGDGYGLAGSSTAACTAPSGYAAVAGDCNDSNAAVYPGATEVCNGIDDNCVGGVDEGLRTTFYRDNDGDGYGVATSTTLACTRPSGYAAVAGDCNDSNASIRPGASEVCNNLDDNCAGGIDDGFSCRLTATQSCTACGFSGSQTCVSGCTWGACGGFALSRVYDTDVSTAFTHACGTNCGDSSGDWCLLGAPSPGCDIISGGPGLAAPPGRYEAEFYFGDTGTYDFYVYNSGAQVGSTTYTSSSGFPRVVVPFTVASGCGNISVRLYGRTGARIRLYSVTIRRIGD